MCIFDLKIILIFKNLFDKIIFEEKYIYKFIE